MTMTTVKMGVLLEERPKNAEGEENERKGKQQRSMEENNNGSKVMSDLPHHYDG